MADVLPASHQQTWQNLEQALVQYHHLLDERRRVLDSVVALEEENARLKVTVQECMEDQQGNGWLLGLPFVRMGAEARGGGGGVWK